MFKKIVLIIVLLVSISALCACEDDPITDEYFTVTFLDIDGNSITSISVLKGEGVTAPDAPIIEGYVFTGWDQEYSEVNSDLVIKPIYEEVLHIYTVIFLSDDLEVKKEEVNEGGFATAPSVEKQGYILIGWDQEFSLVNDNLTINAIWKKIVLNSYASYVDNFNFKNLTDYSNLLPNIVSEKNLKYTYTNIKNGGARGTNELVYYNESMSFNTNSYGFEIAVDYNNILIEKATKVKIPSGGFVLSAHGTSVDKLDNNTKIGDTIIYADGIAKVYRSSEISNTIGLGIELKRLKSEIIKSNNDYLALDYQGILDNYNQAVDNYNTLINNYNSNLYKETSSLALSINFMLIEAKSVTVRAMWHYPLRANSYPENSQEAVETFLDKVKTMGINRVYLNTNFNGKAIYKSEYLSTSLTGNYKYGNYKDYLECFISEAHKRKIEVFAWTNTLIAGDGSNNSFYSSRGWILKGINGEDNQGGMYFVDISNDAVRAFLENVFSELASYDLDGIEYDFIRYPSGNLQSYSGAITDISGVKDWGWTDSCKSKFIDKYNLSEDLLALIKADKDIRTKWLDFKRSLLTSTVKLLYDTINTVNPNIKISAAVMSSASGAKNTYLQDWETWIKQGLIHILEPMIYTADNAYLESSILSMKKVVGDYATIVAGIFPEGSGGEPFMNCEQIKIIQNLELEGASKFSSRTIFNGVLVDSYQYMSRDYIVSPYASKEDIYNAYILDLIDKIQNYYIYRDSDPSLSQILTLIDNFSVNISINEKLNLIKNHIDSVNNSIIKSRLEKENNMVSNYLN